MTPDQRETLVANVVRNKVRSWVRGWARPEDVDACAVAVLVRAVELLTPDLSAATRAQLFAGEE